MLSTDEKLARIDKAANLMWAYLGPRATARLATAREIANSPKGTHPAEVFLRDYAEAYDESDLVFESSIVKWRTVKAEVLALLTLT